MNQKVISELKRDLDQSDSITDAGERYFKLQELQDSMTNLIGSTRRGRLKTGAITGGLVAGGGLLGTAFFVAAQSFTLATAVQVMAVVAISPVGWAIAATGAAVGAGIAYARNKLEDKYDRATGTDILLQSLSDLVHDKMEAIATGPVDALVKSARFDDLVKNKDIALRVRGAFEDAVKKPAPVASPPVAATPAVPAGPAV